METTNKDLTTKENNLPVEAEAEAILGFEDAKDGDAIIPRLKVIQALSPERVAKEAEEGDILNSLTQESYTPDDRFIPVKQYYTNIEWNPDRDADERIFCRSFDGRIGVSSDGETHSCAACTKNQFDNTKTGKDAQPLCTNYMNFLGFFSGTPMPVVLSFARTNYNEGKKMLSIAKSLMKSIWCYTYSLSAKAISKGKNSWFILVPKLAEPTSEEDQQHAKRIFELYAKSEAMKVDYEEARFGKTQDTTELETEI